MSVRRSRRSAAAIAAVLFASLGAGNCFAADARAPSAAPGAAAAPTESVTEELIRLLAERLALSQDDAQRLIGRLRAEQAQPAAAGQLAAAPGGATGVTGEPPATDPKGRVRVIYLTDSERRKIHDEVKQEVLATAESENWVRPDTVPGWVKNTRLATDLRLRQEFDFLDGSNSPQFINFQAINSGSPQNINPPAGQPLTFPVLNSTDDRQQTRIRLRVGLSADVAQGLQAGLRFSTGNSTNPVSTNQTLGNDFNKFTFVVDRAWLNYNFGDEPAALWGGRIPNPWSSTELVWDDDLSFDGMAAQHRLAWHTGLEQRTTLGAFVVGNTDFNYPSTSLTKESSRDKWLLGVQTGIDWQLADELRFEAAVALYDFQHLDGELSSPCFAPNTSVACDSDGSRPAFIQKGNTLFALRDLVVLTPTDPAYQYFGLASEFRVLDINGRIDRRLGGGRHLSLDADIAWNLAYDRGDVRALVPANNFAACPADQPGCTPGYEGGNLAWLLQGKWGNPDIAERGQWNAFAGYRHLDSDAVVDAFTDSDFHLGGTNAKGYYLGGNYGIAHNTWLSARWISTSEVDGAPYAVDLLHLDLNARF